VEALRLVAPRGLEDSQTRGAPPSAGRKAEQRQAAAAARAFARAVWGLSVFGGPWLFQEHMQALLEVRPLCLSVCL
jgi:hypothetical protein